MTRCIAKQYYIISTSFQTIYCNCNKSIQGLSKQCPMGYNLADSPLNSSPWTIIWCQYFLYICRKSKDKSHVLMLKMNTTHSITCPPTDILVPSIYMLCLDWKSYLVSIYPSITLKRCTYIAGISWTCPLIYFPATWTVTWIATQL